MDLVLQALNLEATDFINKPIKREALEAALKRALARREDANAHRERLSLNNRDAIMVIALAGKLLGTANSRLIPLVREAIAAGGRKMVVNFDSNLAVTGAGINALTQMLDECRQADLPVAFCGLSINLKTVFEMLGVTRYIQVLDNEQEAFAAFQD
jgi:anti-anti-sigma regulatory factor